jgi:hypothetical protein
MAALSIPSYDYPSTGFRPCHPQQASLLSGEILLDTRAHTAWGAAVTAQMYLPLTRELVWPQLVNYPRWQQYFPDITHSRVLQPAKMLRPELVEKRLYQTASKTFLFLTAQVEVYLRVVETQTQRIQFYFESGSFVDFNADLHLHDCPNGSLLTYSVQATPLIPIPSLFIQQAIHLDLPSNMRNMRRVICGV